MVVRNKNLNTTFVIFTFIASLVVLPGHANAVPVMVDEIICDETMTPDCTGLSGTVDVVQFDADTLIFVVTNTSTSTVVDVAVLLSGWAFQSLGLDILSGSVALDGSTEINGADASTINDQWGFQNSASGPFQELVSGGTVDTDISTLTAAVNQGGTTFNGDSIPAIGNIVNGPSDGILFVGGDAGMGVTSYQDSLVYTVNFNGDVGTLFTSLTTDSPENYVVLSYGSPVAAVPEPSTLLLLGSGLIGLGLWRSRRRKNA